MSSCFEIASKNSAWKGFWSVQPELNEPSLSCPQPCKWAASCVYNGPGGCGFVHPGEQGTSRKLFAARYIKKGETQRYEAATVRLIGDATFYERRRLRLSWPQWCERKGMPAPVPLSKMVAKPAVVEAPAVAEASTPEQMAASMAWIASMQQEHMAQVMAVRKELQHKIRRNAIGEQLFYLIKGQLEQTVADRKEIGLDHPKITPGLITGMLLENDLEEAEKLITDAEGLGERMIEACEAIIEKFGI